MADKNENLVTKHRLEETDGPEPKHQRIVDSESASTNETKLTDVVDDCLERIFMYLSFQDLLNIAHTNKDLKSAADMAFKRQFGKMEFELWKNGDFSQFSDVIEIADKKNQLRLLRSFGHSISKLTIQPPGEFGKKLVHYANEYCSNSLIAIQFHQSLIKLLPTKPFSKVEVVEFIHCRLYADMELNKWFPAVRRLDLMECSLVNKQFVVEHLPHLKHLKIKGRNRVPPENIFTSLRNNPQLHSICLDEIVLPKNFWHACQKLTRLKSLKILDHSDYLFPKGDTAVHFGALKTLGILIKHDRDLRVILSMAMFDRLEDITLLLYVDNVPDTYHWSNFFKKHPSIEKVTLASCINEINERTITEIVQMLPALKEFKHFAGYFSIDGVVRFVKKFKLMSYGFRLKENDDFEELQKRLGAKWIASKEDWWHIRVIPKL